mgnify:CR=1 FL=1
MPYVKSIPIHSTVNRSIAYILNPEKTEDMVYTTALNCMANAKDAYNDMKMVYEYFSGKKYNAPPLKLFIISNPLTQTKISLPNRLTELQRLLQERLLVMIAR